ncbi:3'-5' exonuclease [Pseudomonas sp. ALS1131]|nr:3'-5' exonuclease [Pseudomonas sp. ALS1131]TRO32681.1 3'-5' exonuclease [Pseudomonas sp. ALS1131]
MTNLAILDLETSGINPNKHSVLEIGIIPLLEGIPPFHAYVKNEEIIWSDFAKENFQKISEEWNAQSTPPREAVQKLSDYLEENFPSKEITLIGHNIGFDISFLKKLAFDSGIDEIPGISHRVIDTHTLLFVLMSQGKLPESALTSSGAFSHFNISPPESIRHTALGDATATRELFKKISRLLNLHLE